MTSGRITAMLDELRRKHAISAVHCAHRYGDGARAARISSYAVGTEPAASSLWRASTGRIFTMRCGRSERAFHATY